jgi:hypothetical protein
MRITKSKRIRWTGQITNTGNIRNAYKCLVGKPEQKRHGNKQNGGLKTDITGTGRQNVNYTDLANNRVQLYILRLGNKSGVPQRAENMSR